MIGVDDFLNGKGISNFSLMGTVDFQTELLELSGGHIWTSNVCGVLTLL